ncbi:dihydropteroate synthase [uncultured Cetobacterium sp.]|uniref:dihydropteroate synthase n=1 Tax=uncultured Cetobacterium sp. TaxID=527638 RepID=UPI00261AEB70|nr:dihydropteroate synthase [uncultured Cetobacterium sp.]
MKFGNSTLIMGILNVTPDSFSDGGQFNSVDSALNQAKLLVAQGADILDIGGQSTRPGHKEIPLEEELRRVIPVIEKISKELDCIISIDTYRYEVADAALQAGAHIINDVWGLQKDNGEMAKVAAKHNAIVVAMHNQDTKEYSEDIILCIKQFFKKTFQIAERNGLDRNKIIIDPGIGFGKGYSENIEVINRLDELTQIAPLLLGVSKKGFIGKDLNLTPDERVEGTIAVNILGISKGVKIIRVHNVYEHKRALAIADKIIYLQKNI